MSLASASTIWALPTTNPIRHPGIEWPLVTSLSTDVRTSRLEQARRRVAVEPEVGVGKVMDEEDLVLSGEADETLEEAGSTQAVVGLWGTR